MTIPFDDVRLKQIIASYGASPERWPEAERNGAMAAASVPDHAALITEESTLDRLLDLYTVSVPGAATIHRVAATAPKARRRWRLLDRWLPSAALATTALAGVVAGATALPAVVGTVAADSESYALSYGFSSFGDSQS